MSVFWQAVPKSLLIVAMIEDAVVFSISLPLTAKFVTVSSSVPLAHAGRMLIGDAASLLPFKVNMVKESSRVVVTSHDCCLTVL